MHVIIVGCGLAGLTVAIGLAKSGHTVEILESAPEITYIGAGIQVTPNSSRVLRKFGVDKFIQRNATEPIDLKMMRWEDGKMLVETPLKSAADERYGSPYWHIHRADFHRGLLERATELGVKLYMDSRIVEVDPYGPSVLTKNGTRFSADLVICSDGLHSMCRGIVLGRPDAAVPTGQMVYRVTLPISRLQGIPDLKDIITIPRNNHWIGPQRTILSYLLEGNTETLLNLVFTCPVKMPDGVNQKIGDNAEVRSSFEGWDPRIDKILEHVDSVLEWRLFTRDELPTWIHASSKVCLIGDCAHPITPYLAQGAAMGIEDAAILSSLLSAFQSPNQLPRTLQLYESIRKPRTTKICAASMNSKYFTQMEDGERQRERDQYLLEHRGIEKGHWNIRSQEEFLDELFGYDAFAVAEAAVKKELERNKGDNRWEGAQRQGAGAGGVQESGVVSVSA